MKTKLTKGRAAEIVHDPDTHQRLLDSAALADSEEGIRQGLTDAKKGKSRPVNEFFKEFETKHGLRR